MRRACFVLMACVLMVGAPVGAQTLYGTLHNGSSPSTFIELNPATGAQIAAIGSVGYAVNGMAWDATTGTLYATTSDNDPSFPAGLIIIDPTTGAGTPVGSGAGMSVNVPTANAAGDLYGWSEGGDDPVLWDTVAGTATVIGESGMSTWEHGLDFDGSDTLYMVNNGDDGVNAEVFLINTATGAGTSVGTIGPLTNGIAHHGKFNPVDGYYYGIDTTPAYSPTAYQIVVLDINGLSVVGSMPTVDRLHTIVFAAAAQPPEPTAVPALSGLGLTLMAILLAGVAVVLVRRFA